MIHIYLFGPTSFVDSLLTLSDMHSYVRGIRVEIEDDDPTLYQTLLLPVEELLTSNKKRNHATSPLRNQSPNHDAIVVLTPRFGDRFSTIALSIPYQELYVVAGVNVEMLCGIAELSTPLVDQIALLGATQDSLSGAQVDRDHDEASILESDEAAQESSSQHSSNEGETSSQSEGRESGTLISPPSDHTSEHETVVEAYPLRSDWSVVTLCEMLSVRGQDGVCFLNSLLRAEDEESNIDLSVLETEYN
jgi:hypothetical protein